MVELAEKYKERGSVFFIGFLQALMLVCGYLMISLLDIWGYFPAIVQAIIYVFLGIFVILFIARGFKSGSNSSIKNILKMTFLCLTIMTILILLVGSDSKRLIEIALKPRAIFSYPIPEIIMTAIPPNYSGKLEFTEYLDPNSDQATTVRTIPEGSKISVRVSNIGYRPTLIAGHQRIDFKSDEKVGFIAEFTVNDELSFQIKEGSRIVGQWPMAVLEDDTPNIERADYELIQTDEGFFGLSLSLSDDYGLKEVTVSLSPVGKGADIISDQKKLAISDLKEFSDDVYVNMASSDLAGLRGDVMLDVMDYAGQKRRTIIPNISLPERYFSNPLARKIIHIRKSLIDPSEHIDSLARELMALGLTESSDLMPITYYVALRSAYWRLTKPKDDNDFKSARDILWNLANDLEGDIRVQFKTEILTQLSLLKTILHQEKAVPEIKEQLLALDKKIVLLIRAKEQSFKDRLDPTQLNIKALRRIYEKILAHSYYGKYDLALDLVTFIEQGFVYNNTILLSEQGYEYFVKINQARTTLNIIKTEQRKIISFMFKNSTKLELASGDIKDNIMMDKSTLVQNKSLKNWIGMQEKLGEDIHDLGRTLLLSGIDVAAFTIAAHDLIQDAIYNMQNGDMQSAMGDQNEILTIFQGIDNQLREKMKYNSRLDDKIKIRNSM
ncbi:MAG: DUF4175 domain-containing protein [Emcibacter sp.]|nr:DUF4175 domain-containing protein [Emcibacter sp.]